MRKSRRKLIATIHPDSDCENPLEYTGWRLCRFDIPPNRRGDDNLPKMVPTPVHFPVSLYRHSLDQWGLRGEVRQCPWDTVNEAGILWWDVSKEPVPPFFDSYASARAALREYTSWINDECYYVSVVDRHGNDFDSCGGFVGRESVDAYLATLDGVVTVANK